MFKKREKRTPVGMIMVALVAGFVASFAVVAATTPTQGDLLFDFYDTFVVNGLGGPAGYVGIAVATIIAGSQIMQSRWLPGAAAGLGAVSIAKADTIAQGFGIVTTFM